MSAANLGTRLIQSVDQLDCEVRAVYENLVLPTWDSEQLHGLPDALYGYVMGVFARIDLASAHWHGAYGRDQSARIVGFMDTYFATDH